MRQGQPRREARRLVRTVVGLMLLFGGSIRADAEIEGPQRLKQLLTGEAWYYFHQKDYFAAISRLQKAREDGLFKQKDADMDILMTRLTLAYGLHDQAGAALNRMREEDLAQGAADRAWYELAKSLFHKGHPAEALEALDNVRDQAPEEIAGDFQLLRSHVLSALGHYADAAQVLDGWRGPEGLAPYAHYNRSIALMRANDYPSAIDVLQRVAGMSAAQEEMLALKDKANLTLGYILLQSGDLERARASLNRVRPQGPFSNRALLAAGMVSQMQGRGEEALVPWMVLRERMLADPAVQEALLAIPYIQRQLDTPEAAAHNYEQAVISLSRELGLLNGVAQSVRKRETLNQLLSRDVRIAPASPASRYLSDLLASRVFQETSSSHEDLSAMLEDADQGLKTLDELQQALPPRLPAARQPAGEGRTMRSPPKRIDPSEDETTQAPVSAPQSRESGAEESLVIWGGVRKTEPPSRGIPLLPEVELPPNRAVTPLPGSGAEGLPGAAEDIGLPLAPEDIGLHLADGGGLPLAAEDIGLPPSGSWRELDQDEGEPSYTEAPVYQAEQAAPSRRLLRRILRPGRAQGVIPDGVTTDEALGELATALGHTTERMGKLVSKLRTTGVSDSLLRERIAALRERILKLRVRIDAALVRHADYARTLALAELMQRKRRLESHLKHARLQLAKTYDLATVE